MQNSQFGLKCYTVLMMACALLQLTIVSGLTLTLLRVIVYVWSFSTLSKLLFNIKNEPPIIKTLLAFYFLLAVYGLLVALGGNTFVVGMRMAREVVPLSFFVKVSWSLLPIFVFYDFGKRRVLDMRFMERWMRVFIIVATVCYLLTLQKSMLRVEEDEVTNNGGYLVLSMVPLLVFLKTRSLQQYTFMAIVLLMIFLSMKRGAILIGIVVAAVYFFYQYRNSKHSTRFGITIALVLGLYGAYYVFDRLSTSSDYFQHRVDETLEGDTSGRDVIHGFFLNYYLHEATPKEQLIGGGANATLELLGMYAHNDWLELAINQGLLGVLLYLAFWTTFVRLLFKKKVPPLVKCSLLMLFTIYFLKTWFSMSYTEYTLYSSMAFGYCIAICHRKQIETDRKGYLERLA